MQWQDVRDRIEREARRIEFTPPDEVVKLLKYQIIPSGQGNFGQAFTTMVYIEGDARSLAYYNVLCLLRLIDEPSLTLDHLKILFKEYVPLSAHFQATCGLETVHRFVQDMLASFDSLKSKDDFKSLLEMFGIYATLIHGWCEHYFPWYVGEMFPQRKKQEVEEMARLFGT